MSATEAVVIGDLFPCSAERPRLFARRDIGLFASSMTWVPGPAASNISLGLKSGTGLCISPDLDWRSEVRLFTSCSRNLVMLCWLQLHAQQGVRTSIICRHQPPPLCSRTCANCSRTPTPHTSQPLQDHNQMRGRWWRDLKMSK